MSTLQRTAAITSTYIDKLVLVAKEKIVKNASLMEITKMNL